MSAYVELNQSRACILVRTAEGYFVVDPDTGELLNADIKQPRRREVSQDVGTDTAFPIDCTHSESLQNAASVHDAYADSPVFYADRVLDLLEFNISNNAVRLLKSLCQNVAGRNVWFGSICDLGKSLGLSQRAIERASAELAAHSLIRVEKLGRDRETKVRVHPWYGFRGDRSVQDQYIKDWTKKP